MTNGDLSSRLQPEDEMQKPDTIGIGLSENIFCVVVPNPDPRGLKRGIAQSVDLT